MKWNWLALSLAFLTIGRCYAAASQVPVNDIYAYAVGDRVEVRWTTPAPSVGQVEFGARRAKEDSSCLRGSTNAGRNSGTGYANNHRATLKRIRKWPVVLRIVARTKKGQKVTSKWVNVSKASAPKVTLEPGEVKIHIDRGAWKDPEPPVTLGVPMLKGALADAAHLRLMHAGKPVPFQASVVSRYREGRTVKWLRVTFLAPKGAKTVTLEYGRPGKSPQTPLTVKRSGKTAIIQTGAATLNFRAGGGDLRSGETVLRLPLGILVNDKGKRFVAHVEKVVLEENGPVMAVLRVNGHHVARGKKHFAFEQRIYAFAGKPYVRLDYTFGNDLVGPTAAQGSWSKKMPKMDSIRSLRLRFAGVGSAPVVVGTGKERCTLTPRQRVFQREDFEWVQEPGKLKGKRMEGVVRVGNAHILTKNFWEQWPKSVARDRSALHVGLCPKLPAKFYANRKDEHKLYFWVRDGMHTFRPGLAKTHILYLDVSGKPAAESLIADEPVACCDPLWIEKTGVLRGLAVRHYDQFPHFNKVAKTAIGRFKSLRDGAREFGLMNFGDWYGERRYNWGNLEYDLHHGFFKLFARSADARFFRIAADIARHQGDIDTRHWSADPRRVGQQWLHCMGHTGGYFPYNYMNMKIYSLGYSDNRGHVWNRGLLEHYLLGGDRRSWESALLIADWVAGPQTTNFNFGNCREPGWLLVIAMPTYLATEDPFYLNGARLMLRKVREKAKATGDHGFYNHKLGGGHCNCKVKHYGCASFMLATQLTGMHMYYEVTRDDETAKELVKAVRFLMKNNYVASDGTFRYTTCPKTGAGSSTSWMLAEGLAFAARYSKDPEITEMALKSITGALGGMALSGKGGGFRLCFAVQGLHEAARIPGPSFRTRIQAAMVKMRSPARRWLPALVPNPDFEENAAGWPNRGYNVTRSTEVFHSGKASMRIEGSVQAANEYVNTVYDTGGSPAEIQWLKPGKRYRLTAWLRVDRLDPGTRKPTVRIQFRDASGSRGGARTNGYKTSEMRTWQKLTCDFTLPKWNTRNYIALNTGGARPSGGLLYFDDISVVPIEKAKADTYAYVRLDAPAAKCSGNTRPKRDDSGLGHGLSGTGTAAFDFDIKKGGPYYVRVKLVASAREVGQLTIDGKTLKPVRGSADPLWAHLGAITLSPGAHVAKLQITDDKAWIGRIVLTNDQGEE